MPASPQSSGTAGSILLVEEYGALAAAISSALKKFAPGYTTRVVRSLDDAQNATETTTPDLLVIDFDPPQQGALDLFIRLKSSAPGARVVFIAAASVELASAAAHIPGAFQFVEKPFDLASLGAAVQNAIGTRSNGGPAPGALRELALRDVIPLQCLSEVTAVLKVDASEGRTGEVHFIDGQISHAETTETDGIPALQEMLRWRAPRLKQPKRRPRAARTIEGKWTAVLADALSTAEAALDTRGTDDEGEHIDRRVGGGKKIVVIDDTEMLLVFVEDSLAAADPTLEITTASTGAQGVQRVAAVKPDLVLLDYSLPDFNGDEVCKRLLADPATASIPVLMMSGHVPEMGASALRCENIVATVAKPFLSDALVSLVKKVLADPAEFAVRSAAPASARSDARNVESPAPQSQPEHRPNGQHTAPPPAPSLPSPPATATNAPAPSPPALTGPIVGPPAEAPSVPAPQPPPPVVQPPAASAVPAFKHTAVAPPPPIPVMAPAPRPVLRRPPAEPATHAIAVAAPPAARPAPLPIPSGIAPARIATATTNAVILGLALEVLAIQFSPALQMAAIRARPASRTISLHVHPEALSSMNLPEAGFELGPVNLDARGQIDTIRLLPSAQRIGPLPTRAAFPVGGVSVLPANGGKAVELTPAAAAPMMMVLSAPFELCGVQLSPTFGVGSLLLKARPGEIRVSLESAGARSGAKFETAQVLLNRSAQIAEILLDAVA